MSDLSDGLNVLFDERRKFVIIGITGRTGSGCTTASKILSSDFNTLSLSKDIYKTKDLAEQLRYKIIYEYIKLNWAEFEIVRIKDILTTFVLEEPFDNFVNFCALTLGLEREKLQADLPLFIGNSFTSMHEDRMKVKSMLSENKQTALANESVYNFYFRDLPIFTDSLKEFFERLTENGFISIYQQIGNNVRRSGNPYSDKFDPLKLFHLAQRTNVPIKILRRKSLDDQRRVLVAIDSIRNPYEASFFKERYAAFYLFSITTQDNQRTGRLHKHCNYNDEQIKQIDKMEYPKKLKGSDKFTSLNIQQCIQMADVHINNNDTDGDNRSEFTWNLTKYIALIYHPGLVNPSAEERLMQIAYNAKLSSGCISRQVGAVVTDSQLSVKAIGWNDAPRGQTPCVLRNADWLIKNENLEVFSDYEVKNIEFRKKFKDIFEHKSDDSRLQGCNLSFCFKDMQNYVEGEKNQVHTRALHAEENAFLQIAKYGGTGVSNGSLFTTASPCELCSKKAYQLGIKQIYYIDPYPGIAESHILSSGKSRPTLKLFEGAIGRAYQQLFDPIMPNKDIVDLLVKVELPNKLALYEKEIKELKQIIADKEEIILRLDPAIYD